jgi:hypothetical protein
MNRPPMFVFDGGAWHRPDSRQLSSARGLGVLCKERVEVAAVAFKDCRPVDLRCYDCEEKFERAGNAGR